MHVFWFFKEGKTNGHHFSVSFFPCPSLWLFSQVFGVLLVQTIIYKYGRITEFVSCYLQFVSEMGPRQCLGRMDDGKSWSLDGKQNLIRLGLCSKFQVGYFI